MNEIKSQYMMLNHIEEPELMANANSDAPKKPVNVFDFKPFPKATQCEK